MIIIVDENNLAITAGRVVELLSDRGIIDHDGQDEAGNYIGGQVLLYVSAEHCTLHEVEELPAPWLPGAYRWDGAALQLDESTEAWRAHLDEKEAAFGALVREYDGHVQAHIDAVARAFRYGDPNRPEVSPILHAITYADEASVPKFQAEGRLLRAWRSRYWAATWPILDAVRAGQRPVPSPADLLAELDAAEPPPTADEVAAETARLSAV